MPITEFVELAIISGQIPLEFAFGCHGRYLELIVAKVPMSIFKQFGTSLGPA